MITKEFETNRLIFFVTDDKIFNFVEFSPPDEIISHDASTISLFCENNAGRLEEDPDIPENTVYIYLNEHLNVTDDMLIIFEGELLIPSKTISIFESDQEIVFKKNIGTNSVHIIIYVNKNYVLMDAPTIFHIGMSFKIDANKIQPE